MTDRTPRGAGPAKRAHHAGDDGPALAESSWRGRRRMSAKRKQSALLRLLRGEDLGLLSRELGITAAELSTWPDAFMAAGEAALKTWPADGRDVEISRLKAKVGELTMANELLDAKIDRLETHRPLAWRRSRRWSRVVSPSANRPYGVQRVTRVWGASRATVYRHRCGEQRPRSRPGPVGPMPDEALVEAIRALLAASPCHGEGYRKIWARLRFAGVRTSKRRVLRLTREHGLQAPGRVGRPHGPRAHDGTIRTERVDAMWGTDLTSTLTGEGQASIFVTVDHASSECLGIHAARRATRFEALEPLRQAVRFAFGTFGQGSAGGLKLRHDPMRGCGVPAPPQRAASSSPTTSNESLPFSGSRARPPSCANPRATAASSASSAH